MGVQRKPKPIYGEPAWPEPCIFRLALMARCAMLFGDFGVADENTILPDRKSGYQMGIIRTESDELQYTYMCCCVRSGTCVNGGRSGWLAILEAAWNEPVKADFRVCR